MCHPVVSLPSPPAAVLCPSAVLMKKLFYKCVGKSPGNFVSSLTLACVSVSVSGSGSGSGSLSLYLCLCLCCSVSIILSLSVSASLFVSLSVCLSLSLSPSLSVLCGRLRMHPCLLWHRKDECSKEYKIGETLGK